VAEARLSEFVKDHRNRVGNGGENSAKMTFDQAAKIRSPEHMTINHERLTIVQGDAMDENQLAHAMQNRDAAVSTLGPCKVFRPTLRGLF